jgi:hypothetical protein
MATIAKRLALAEPVEVLAKEPLPWTSDIGSEHMRTLILARLPADATGRDVENLFTEMGLRVRRSPDLHLVQARVPGGSRLLVLPTRWLVTASVDPESDRVLDVEVQHLSQV